MTGVTSRIVGGPVTTTSEPQTPLLRTTGLSKWYGSEPSAVGRLAGRPSTRLHAVADVSLTVSRGETYAIVGETGSGKSTLGRLIVRLEDPTSGDVLIDGTSVLGLHGEDAQRLRRTVQIILQDPYSTLNPYRTVAATIGEVLKVHGMRSRPARDAETDRLLALVGFPVTMRDRLPGQLSGGGRQRVSIARALAVRPKLIVADEPVSALDVSVQAQVLNLFERLRDELGLAYVFITHDLAVVKRLADRIAVMYLGRIVEEGPAEQIVGDPKHPYTRALLAAAPSLDADREPRAPLAGDMPNPIEPPSGCVFHPRCPAAMDVCGLRTPVVTLPDPGRSVSCHLYPSSPELGTAEGDVTA
jgi:oligopeptide/dipeptide ABC transporter ATP-binding protein